MDVLCGDFSYCKSAEKFSSRFKTLTLNNYKENSEAVFLFSQDGADVSKYLMVYFFVLTMEWESLLILELELEL